MGFFSKKSKPTPELPSAAGARYGNNVGVNHGSVMQSSFTQAGSDNSMDVRMGQTSHSHSQLIGIVGGSAVMQLDQPQDFQLNGLTYYGRRVEERNGRILLDGRDVTYEVAVPGYRLEIHITGTQNVAITGAVGQVHSVYGAISIQGDVSGSVQSVSGAIECGKVGGDVKTVSGHISVKS